MPIDAIYLDTNCLRGENWAAPSAALTEALELANALKVPVFVPELVMIESEEVFFRDIRDQLTKIADVFANKIASRLQDGTSPKLPLPNLDEFRKQYQSQSSAKLKQYGIEPVALPEISLHESLYLSAAHRTPFRDADTGFRDSIISMSCAEHSKKSGFKDAVLVANDDGMKTAGAYLERHHIRILPKAKDLSEKLTAQLHADLRAQFQQRQDELKNALKAHLSEISTFLSGGLHVPKQLDGVLEPVLQVTEVIADEITSVTAGYEPIGETEVHGGAEVKARIIAYTMPNPYMDEWLDLPEKTRSAKDLIPVLREIEAPITVDFKVKRVGDKLIFAFNRAEIGSIDDALTRLMVKNSMRAAIVKPRVGGNLPKS